MPQGGEHRRQHGDGAEHRETHDDHGAGRQPLEDVETGEEETAHTDHHGEAGNHHGVTGRTGRHREGVLGAASRDPFLPLPSQIEQRVVDADGHADEQDDGGGGTVDRHELSDGLQQAEGADDRGRGEQQGDTGGDQRAEDDEQDHQGQGQRGELGLREVVLDRVVDDRVQAAVTGLHDP